MEGAGSAMHRSLRGFSFVEFLAALGVMMAIAGVLGFAAQCASKPRHNFNHPINQLKQIGMAHALYLEEGFGAEDAHQSFSVRSLVNAGYLEPEQAATWDDPTPWGYANAHRAAWQQYADKHQTNYTGVRPHRQFKDSFVAWDSTMSSDGWEKGVSE